MSDESEFVPLVKAAARMQVNRRTLTRLVGAGRIPYYVDAFDGRKKLLSAVDLERLRAPQVARREANAA